MSLLLAGNASSAGKTTTAIGLAAALAARGRPVQPAKAGPDFLDAGWLAKACGRPCPNLDMFMAEKPEDLPRILGLFANPGDFVLVEGAMGLFDGAEGGQSSSASLACLLDLPVLLLLNARGMGQSIAALAQGFLSYQQPGLAGCCRFCGLICTHVASERHERILRQALGPVLANFGVPLLGCLRSEGAPAIASRHLGLTQAAEQELDFNAAGEWLARQIDLEPLLRLPGRNFDAGRRQAKGSPRLVAAIAKDNAFSFCYADLPLLLAELGAEILYFSPLADARPPECDCIYLPGGYPELYARELAANAPMLAALAGLAGQGLPIYGECGGYIYLLEKLVDLEKRSWPMTGILQGQAVMGKRLASLGYREARGHWPTPCHVLGHEFHYAKDALAGGDTLWDTCDARAQKLGFMGRRKGSCAGSWLHLYPAGSRAFWRGFLQAALNKKMEKRHDRL